MACTCAPDVEQHPIPDSGGCTCNPRPLPPGCGCTTVEPCPSWMEKPCTTKYYHLPLWRANSVTSWLVGINGAMELIDKLFHDFALRTKLTDEDFEIVDEVNNLGDRMETIEDEFAGQMSDIADCISQISSIMGAYDLVNSKLTTAIYNLSNVETRLKTLEIAKENGDKEVDMLQAQVEALSSTVGQIVTEKEDLAARLQTVEENVRSLNGLVDRVEDLEISVQDIYEEIGQLKAVNNKQSTTTTDLGIKVENNVHRINAVEANVQSLTERVTTLEG